MRLSYLDYLKGVLILLVVWGHVVQNASADFFSTVTFRTIYCFHMATFFFVSGLVLRLGRHGMANLAGKVLRLVVPYLAWYVMLVAAHRQISPVKAVVDVFSPNGMGLWFLFTLSECIGVCVISDAFAPARHHCAWMVVFGCAAIMLALLGRHMPVDVRHLAKYYQYFLGGFLLAPMLEVLFARGVKWLIFSGFVLGLVGAAISGFDGVKFQCYKSIVAWMGCISLVLLFKEIPSDIQCLGFLLKLGRMTLGIYAVHVFLLELCGGTIRNWPLWTTFLFLVFASVAVVYLIGKSKLLSFFFLGRWLQMKSN